MGVIAGIVAFLLYNLIGLFTNLSFYHAWSFHFRSPANNQLGPWVIVMPVIGGIIVGFMAKYGSPKIKGHGIPEAMEAVLTSKSRIEAKVAILKPISAAIAIGTGGPFGADGTDYSSSAGRSVRSSASWFRPLPRSARYCWPAARAPAWPRHSILRLPESSWRSSCFSLNFAGGPSFPW